MPRSVFIAAFVTLAFLGSAEAASSLTVPRPPAMLSPDLTEPWLLQIKPGSRAVISDPRPRTAYLAPLSSLKPKVASRRPEHRQGIPAAHRLLSRQRAGGNRHHRYQATASSISFSASGKARRYGVGVGRPGFEWAGVRTITQQGRVADLDAARGDARAPARPARSRWRAARTIRSAPARSISATRSIASTARTSPGRSATPSRPAASACATRTSSTSTTG